MKLTLKTTFITYQKHREPNESYQSFTNRDHLDARQDIFSNDE